MMAQDPLIAASNLTTELELYLQSPESIYLQYPNIRGIVVGAMVFQQRTKERTSNANPPKTLILRRVSSDTFPLKWELPGGGAEIGTDETIVDTAVRELREETSLRAKRVVCAVRPRVKPGQWTGALGNNSVVDLFQDKEGNDWGVVSFLVETGNEFGNEFESVVVNPQEHIEWAWVSKDEVSDKTLFESGSQKAKELVFVSDLMHSTILEGFDIIASLSQS